MNLTYDKKRPNGSHFPDGTYLEMGTVKRTPAINNPYVRFHSIPVNIRRHFTDVNGLVIPKNIVPAALQVEYPFFVFGEFDRQGGYAAGLRALAPQPGTYYLTSFIQGNQFTSQFITGFSGVNTVKNRIAVGDIVHVYTDDVQNPTYFIWLVQSFNQGSIGSIVANSDSRQHDGLIGPIILDSFKLGQTGNENQFSVPFFFINTSNLTMFKANQVQPLMFKDPYVEQPDIIDIQCSFDLDQYVEIGYNFMFDTDEIRMTFKLAKH